MTITIEKQKSNRYRVWEGPSRGDYRTRVFSSFAAIGREYGFTPAPIPDFAPLAGGALATVTITGLRPESR